jgi:hypothetical protein
VRKDLPGEAIRGRCWSPRTEAVPGATLLRAKSTVFTGGLGNAALATAEVGGALIVSLLALAAPLAAVLVVGVCTENLIRFV